MRMARLAMAWTALGLVAAAAWAQEGAAPEAGPKVELKQKYPAGSYVMTIDMKIRQDMVVGGEAAPSQDITQTFTVGMKVAPPDEAGTRTMEMVYRRIQQRISVAGQELAYDSSAPAEEQHPELARMLGPLTKARIAITIGPDGRVARVAGLDEIWDAQAKQNPAMAAMFTRMKQEMGNAMVNNMMAQSERFLPDKPVAKGERWATEGEVNVPILGRAKVQYACELADLRETPGGKVAVIEVKGTVTSDEGGAAQPGPIPMALKKLRFEQTGRMEFNADAGMIVRQGLKQSGRIEGSMTGADGSAVPLVIEQAMAMEVRVEKED